MMKNCCEQFGCGHLVDLTAPSRPVELKRRSVAALEDVAVVPTSFRAAVLECGGDPALLIQSQRQPWQTQVTVFVLTESADIAA